MLVMPLLPATKLPTGWAPGPGRQQGGDCPVIEPHAAATR